MIAFVFNTEQYYTGTPKNNNNNDARGHILLFITQNKTKQNKTTMATSHDTLSHGMSRGKNDLTPTQPKSSSKKKTTSDFFDRMSKAETYATADMKGKIDKTPKKVSSGKKTTNSFFERMANTDTYASRDMKE